MKHLKFVSIFAIALIVFSMIPAVVFGATTEYNNGVDWSAILEDNNINIESGKYVIFRDTSGYYYVGYMNYASPTPSLQAEAKVNCNGNSIANTSSISFIYDQAYSTWRFYKSSSSYNPYGTYTLQSLSSQDTHSFNVSAIMANSVPIKNNGTVVFQSTPLVQVTILTLSGVITSPILVGVLTEVTSILPVLLPTLIAFLAIRKGIRFTLKTLRRA